jgi:hypothetical protein
MHLLPLVLFELCSLFSIVSFHSFCSIFWFDFTILLLVFVQITHLCCPLMCLFILLFGYGIAQWL